jgi:ribosomal protein S9
MTTPAFYSGTGRRKTAIARVRLLPGEGEIVVNGRSLEEHFGNAINEADVKMPFRVTGTEGRFNAMIKVEGAASRARPARSATASPAPCSNSIPTATACRCARPASSRAIRA